LLALGGGLERKSGRLSVSRMQRDEITMRNLGEELVFARTSRRNWYLGGDDIANKAPAQATTHTQQYKFIRLEKRANYEPLVLCLKGLQIAYNPGDYLTAEQLQTSPHLRRQYQQLKRWAADPTPISPHTTTRFLNTVQKGLMNERPHGPAHKRHYIEWALASIAAQLQLFNQQLQKTGR
jgi:hypothetical protein